MRLIVSIVFQLIFLSASSASIFLASAVVFPLSTVSEKAPLQMPRLKLRFNDFSPAFAALEDDYYLSTYELETIPRDIAATELRPASREVIYQEIPQIRLPQMSVSAAQEEVVGTLVSQAVADPTQRQDEPEKKVNEILESQKKENGITGKFSHFWLQGKLELTEGLAISDPRDILRVGWFVNGEHQRDGKISLRDGSYEIKVDHLEGDIIAELVDRNGYVIGEAIIDLDLLSKQRLITGFVIPGVDLKLRPYNFSHGGQVIGVYDNPTHPQGIADAGVNLGDHDLNTRTGKNGKFEQQSVSSQSTGLIVAEQARHRQTVVLADFQRGVQIRMFPDPFVEALFDTIDLPKKMRNDGVIFGQISRGAKPVLGYQVRLAEQKANAIYFQMYIADVKSQKTSEDGQFAFVGMADGEYEVEVVDTVGRLVDSKLVSVRAGAISDVRFDIEANRNVSVRAFDPLTTQSQSIEFFLQGQSSPLKAQTEELLKMAVYPGQEPLFVYTQVEGSEQEAVSLISRNKKFQEVSVLNASWWQGVKDLYKISVDSGVIVGFIDTDEAFEVYVDHQTVNTKILYFDQYGKPFDKTSGLKPAGFLIYGIGRGLHTLILDSEEGPVHSEAAYVDGKAIALIYKAI